MIQHFYFLLSSPNALWETSFSFFTNGFRAEQMKSSRTNKCFDPNTRVQHTDTCHSCHFSHIQKTSEADGNVKSRVFLFGLDLDYEKSGWLSYGWKWNKRHGNIFNNWLNSHNPKDLNLIVKIFGIVTTFLKEKPVTLFIPCDHAFMY